MKKLDNPQHNYLSNYKNIISKVPLVILTTSTFHHASSAPLFTLSLLQLKRANKERAKYSIAAFERERGDDERNWRENFETSKERYWVRSDSRIALASRVLSASVLDNDNERASLQLLSLSLSPLGCSRCVKDKLLTLHSIVSIFPLLQQRKTSIRAECCELFASAASTLQWRPWNQLRSLLQVSKNSTGKCNYQRVNVVDSACVCTKWYTTLSTSFSVTVTFYMPQKKVQVDFGGSEKALDSLACR